MKERIKDLRNSLKMTQQKFADRLGLKRQTIAAYEIGNIVPSDSTLLLICKEFNVNEKWLRSGTGEMFKTIPAEDETAAIVSNLLEEENAFYDIIKSIMKTFDQLDPTSQDALISFSEQLLHNLKTKKED
ncbi:MAG: helix-turn-helix transcriptional regulator [Lachnospiraceae bacterium]|nr:helix-turn-helix transcriptional regulator [Lachnospiraceae bacterium]